jgi:hypothetical protein
MATRQKTGTRRKEGKTSTIRTLRVDSEVYNRLHQLVDPVAQEYEIKKAPYRISFSEAMRLFLQKEGLW